MAGKSLQYATFVTLLSQHDGDFGSAYATLVEMHESEVVSEKQARDWADSLPPGAIPEQQRLELRRFVNDGILPSAELEPLARKTDRAEMVGTAEALEAGALRLLTDVVNDQRHERFEPKTRAQVAVKVLEMFATPDKLRAGKSPGQEFHQSIRTATATFGGVPDRVAFTMFVREGEDVERFAAALMTADPMLERYPVDAIRRDLNGWQRDGVVWDGDGTLKPWEEALSEVRHSLKLVNQPKG